MTGLWQRIKGSRRPDYDRLPLSEKEPVSPAKSRSQGLSPLKFLGVVFALLGTYGIFR
jgi:hypothetical protein